MNKLFKQAVLILGIILSSKVCAELILSPSGQPSLANNEQMIKIADMGDDKLAYTSYLDKNSLEIQNDSKNRIITYTTYWQYAKAIPTQAYGKYFLSYIDAFITKTDCQNHKMMLLGTVSHGKDGMGIGGQKISQLTWLDVPKKSYAEYEMNFVCKYAGY